MNDGRVNLVVMIELKESEFSRHETFIGIEIMEQMIKKLQKCKSINVTIVVTKNEDFGTMDLKNLNRYISMCMLVK